MIQSRHCDNDNNYNDGNMMCVSVWFEYLGVYFNVKTHNIGEEYMVTKSEIQTKNIRSLGLRELREGLTLNSLILRSVCIFVCCVGGGLQFPQ
jgi:hypothetical protein